MMGVKTVKIKAMKMGSYKQLDADHYIWFRQQREKKVPVSSPLLQEKAKLLFEQLYPDSRKTFSACKGFSGKLVSDMVSKTYQFKVKKSQLI